MFHSLSISRGLAKRASFRCVTSVELESVSLLKWQSSLQMPWLVVVWTIVTLFRGLSSFNQHKLQSIQNTLARIVTNHRKYTHVTPILQKLHWLPVKYRCIFKTATLVYKFLHSGSPSYFEPFMSFSSCPYSTRHNHPDRQYLTVPPFRSSVFKSANILAIVLPLMLLRSGMTSLKMSTVQHQLPPSERSLKHTCLQKPTHHSLHRHICVSLVRPGYVP